MSPASNSSSSGSRWGKTKTRTFLKSNVQNLFRTVEKSWKSQSVWSQWSFKQIRNATFSPFHRTGESDPYITSPNIFYQSFHQRHSRNDHLVGHCNILFAKEISGRCLTFLILDSITSNILIDPGISWKYHFDNLEHFQSRESPEIWLIMCHSHGSILGE